MESPINKLEKTVEHSLKEEEEKLEQEAIKLEKKIVETEKKIWHNKWVQSSAIVALVLIATSGLLYWQMASTRVKIDNSLVSAPTIDLSASASGILQEIYVKEGDTVAANTAVAKVGDDLIKTTVGGVIVAVQNDIGKNFNAGQSVVTMIDPKELRIVGTIEENKGLSKIKVGQLASFTVDAFGSKNYVGVVDEISSTSHQSGVVFNISDQRATQTFDIKVRFNIDKYPELKNGMSAKLTIFTK